MIYRTDRILRRFALWSVICAVSAAPSFAWAESEYNRAAMVFGVALFILLYTATTSTDAFERFKNRPFMRRTLYIGYGVRLAISIIFPVGLLFDLMPGILSVRVVSNLHLGSHSFEGTLLTTIVQGTFLNILLTVLMAGVYGIQRLTMRPPADTIEHGFAVVMPGDRKKRLPLSNMSP